MVFGTLCSVIRRGPFHYEITVRVLIIVALCSSVLLFQLRGGTDVPGVLISIQQRAAVQRAVPRAWRRAHRPLSQRVPAGECVCVCVSSGTPFCPRGQNQIAPPICVPQPRGAEVFIRNKQTSGERSNYNEHILVGHTVNSLSNSEACERNKLLNNHVKYVFHRHSAQEAQDTLIWLFVKFWSGLKLLAFSPLKVWSLLIH